MRTLRLTGLFVLAAFAVMAAELKGTVSCSGKGMGGIVVSDGLNCVKTAANGAFTLAGHEKAQFVTVSIPAGYRPKVRHYLKVEEGKTQYDFELLSWPRSATDTIRFIQFSDTEQGGGSLVWADNARDYANAVGAAALIHSGDICYRNGLKYHAENVNPEKLGMPIYYTNGNHDLLKDDPAGFGEKTFEELFGPPFYSWNAGKLHIVMLPVPYGDAKTGYKTVEVARWLKNDLEMKDPEQALIMVTHFVHGVDGDLIYGSGTDCPVDMSQYNLICIIYGHHHDWVYSTYKNGAVSVCTPPPGRGGIDFSSGSFPVYTFEKTKLVDVERRFAKIDHLCLFSTQSNSEEFGNEILVNAYDSTSPVASIVVRFFNDEKTNGEKEFLRKSHWTWGLPKSEIPKETTKLIVTATFEDGQKRDVSTVYGKLVPSISFIEDAGKETWGSAYGNSSRTASFGKKDEENKSWGQMIKLWTSNVGNPIFEASPVIENGTVFVATMPDSKFKGAGIRALDLMGGKQKWAFEIPYGVRQSLDVYNGVVVAMDDHNGVYGLNAADGTVRWKRDDLALRTALPMMHANILDGERYIMTCGSTLMALETLTGKTIWENKDAGAACSRTSTPQSIVNGVIFWSRHWASTNGYDAKTGQKLWSKNDGKIFRYRGLGVIPYNNELALLASYSGGVVLLEPRTGEIKKQFDASGNKQVGGVPLLYKNLVIYGTANLGLLAYDVETGERKWQIETDENLVSNAPYTTGGKTVFAGPVLVNGFGVVGANDGNLYVFNPETGEVVEKLNLGAPIIAPVAVVGHRLVVADLAGNVHCFMF
ncbi:MAG: PQQ-binding-like beta-propeller repeat protein [Victivallales bacterium]|nr:PQQ-binding-like beta-propeller repeat protein [Victivallales bacterium]